MTSEGLNCVKITLQTLLEGGSNFFSPALWAGLTNYVRVSESRPGSPLILDDPVLSHYFSGVVSDCFTARFDAADDLVKDLMMAYTRWAGETSQVR